MSKIARLKKENSRLRALGRERKQEMIESGAKMVGRLGGSYASGRFTHGRMLPGPLSFIPLNVGVGVFSYLAELAGVGDVHPVLNAGLAGGQAMADSEVFMLGMSHR